jgi:hypothetical protein
MSVAGATICHQLSRFAMKSKGGVADLLGRCCANISRALNSFPKRHLQPATGGVEVFREELSQNQKPDDTLSEA